MQAYADCVRDAKSCVSGVCWCYIRLETQNLASLRVLCCIRLETQNLASLRVLVLVARSGRKILCLHKLRCGVMCKTGLLANWTGYCEYSA